MKSAHTDIVYLRDGKACGDNHWFEKDRQIPNNALVIQVHEYSTNFDLQSFQKYLCKMKESVVVVLPKWCELVEVVD